MLSLGGKKPNTSSHPSQPRVPSHPRAPLHPKTPLGDHAPKGRGYATTRDHNAYRLSERDYGDDLLDNGGLETSESRQTYGEEQENNDLEILGKWSLDVC